MELKRVLAKDSRTALETISENYGKNTVIVESNKVQGKIEMIVAVDIDTENGTISKTGTRNKTKEPNQNLVNTKRRDFFVLGHEKIIDLDNSLNSFVGCCSAGTGQLYSFIK